MCEVVKKLNVYAFGMLLALNPLVGFSSVCFTESDPKYFAYSELVADLNNDGIDDKYVLTDDHSRITLSFEGQELIDVYDLSESWAISEGMLRSNYGIPTEIEGVDVNNDGFIDVILAFGSRLVIRLNDGSGGFLVADQVELSISELHGISLGEVTESMLAYGAKVILLDINRDGYSDLVVVNSLGVSIFSNSQGHFSYENSLPISTLVGKEITNIYTADLDVDDSPELVINSYGSYIIYISASFEQSSIQISNSSNNLSPIDFDSDGDLDLMEDHLYEFCQIPEESDITTYWVNEGGGVFTEQQVRIGGGFGPILVDLPVDEVANSDSEDKADRASGVSIYFIFLIVAIKGLTKAFNRAKLRPTDAKRYLYMD